MTPDEFRAACQVLWGVPGAGWGAETAAVALGVNARNVFYWGNGSKGVPEGVAAELRERLRTACMFTASPSPYISVLRGALP